MIINDGNPVGSCGISCMISALFLDMKVIVQAGTP